MAFKEICPAGPGYHYSASALQFNQRATEQLGARGAPLVTPSNHGNFFLLFVIILGNIFQFLLCIFVFVRFHVENSMIAKWTTKWLAVAAKG